MVEVITPSTIIVGIFCLAVFAIVMIGEPLEKKYKAKKKSGASRI